MFKILNIIVKFIRKTGNIILCVVIGLTEGITEKAITSVNGKNRTLKDDLMDFIVGLFVLGFFLFCFYKEYVEFFVKFLHFNK